MESKVRSVHKFGGTSLAGAKEFRRVVGILRELEDTPVGVVVSASAGVTDALHALVEAAQSREPWDIPLDAVKQARAALAGELLDIDGLADHVEALNRECSDIADVLRAVYLLGRASPETYSLVAGYGEIWSARLLSACLCREGIQADWFNARDVLTIADSDLGPAVEWETTHERLAEAWTPPPRLRVITGYIARDAAGAPTTLGRNGSDFTASIFSALLGAGELVIWTDVDGVMSGDPRRIPDVSIIPELSYHEAMELAYFGAKVIHPRTMAPVVARGIPVWIRNTARPDLPGTRIGLDAADGGVKGITTIAGMALLNLEGAGLIGVPGTASRLFSAFKEAGISVVLISQGSSEHSICCAVPDSDASRARKAAERAFAVEIRQGQVEGVGVVNGCSILAVVGDGMQGTPGVAAKLFGSLGRAGVNVRAIAQGASERNISAVIDSHEADRALRAVHSAFYLSPETLSIGVLGPGGVGGTLLDQMAGEVRRFAKESKLELRVRMHSPTTWRPSTCPMRSSSTAPAARTWQPDMPTGWSGASTSSRRASSPARRRCRSGAGSVQPAWPAGFDISTRPRSAPVCRSSRRCVISSTPATRSSPSRACFPAPWLSCSTATTGAGRSPRSSGKQDSWATPSRTPGTTFPAWTWPGSS
jgi:aspartokinase/homoserine dehydrogenase 1